MVNLSKDTNMNEVITEINDSMNEVVTDQEQQEIELQPETENQEVSQKENSISQENLISHLEDAIDGAAELDEEETIVFHDWSTENVTVRTLIKRYQENKIVLPLCQRLYVWNKTQRQELFNSVQRNLPCGTIIVSEYDGVQYLLDGLQRLTSLILLSNEKDTYTKEERKLILDYKVTLTCVHDVTEIEMRHYFGVLNSGAALASAVKERSKLSEELNTAILQIANHEFFKRFGEEANATFNKSSHNQLIAMNALLAVNHVAIGDNKAKKLCDRLKENEENILLNAAEAEKIMDILTESYTLINNPAIIKRSLNANFLGVLVYIIAENPDKYESKTYAALINHIFAEKRAIKVYSETTSSGAADGYKCQDRYDCIVDLLNDPDSLQEVNKNALKEWKKEYKDKPLRMTTDKGTIVDLEEFTEAEQQALYLAYRDGKTETWNKLIESTYKVLEAKGEKTA